MNRKTVSAEALAALDHYLGNPSAWENGVSGAVEAAMRQVHNSACDLTAADVAAWLVAQTAALKLPDAEINCYTSRYFPGKIRWLVSTAQDGMGSGHGGDTLEEAVAKVRANIKSPKDKVEALRAQAAELQRQAAELEATIAPTP